MKKILFNLVIIILILIYQTGTCQFIKRVRIGAQYWSASQNYYHERLGINIAEQHGNLFGPDIFLKMGKFTIGSSMFFGSFKWLINENDMPTDIHVQRNGIDFSIGITYMENFNLFALIQNRYFEGEKSYSDLENRDYRIHVEDKGTLFGGGFSSIFLIPQPQIFILTYISYTLGHMQTAYTQYLKDVPVDELSDAWKYDANMLSVMLGVGYQLDSGLSFILSYNRSTSNKTAGELRIKGLILTLSYSYPPIE